MSTTTRITHPAPVAAATSVGAASTLDRSARRDVPARALALEVRGVSVAFGAHPVLDRLHLDVAAGEAVALVGPSGCGKSTLLALLAGVLVATRGREGVHVQGELAVGGAPPAPGRCGLMPQRDALLAWRRTLDNAALGARLAGAGRAEARAAAHRALVDAGLGDDEHRWPGELSGGMRQRVALVRTLLARPGAILLDEPLGALDHLTRRSARAFLADRVAAAGPDRPSVLLVTHDVEEAVLLADRVVVLSPRPARVVAVVATPPPADRHAPSPAVAACVARVLDALEVTS